MTEIIENIRDVDDFEVTLRQVLTQSRGSLARISIMRNLAIEPMNARKLSVLMGLDYKTIRHHLRVLEERGVILSSRKDMYARIYFASENFRSSKFWIDSNWLYDPWIAPNVRKHSIDGLSQIDSNDHGSKRGSNYPRRLRTADAPTRENPVLKQRSILVGQHTIAVYSDKERKVRETLGYLKEGLASNQAIVYITSDLSKDEVRSRMETDWKIDIQKLETSGDVTLRSPDEWYLGSGSPDWRKINSMFLSLRDESLKRGRTGLRGAGDTGIFFHRNFVQELIDYESSFERKLSIAFTPLCTYNKEDFDTLSLEQLNRLSKCHFHFWVQRGIAEPIPA